MASSDFSGTASPREERLPGAGFTAHFNPVGNVLKLEVNELDTIHYMVQPSAQPQSVIRFRTGEMFSIPLDLSAVKEALRSGTLFTVTPVHNSESSNLQKATADILNRKPYEAMIDVKLPSDMSDLTLVLNGGKINDGRIACDTMEKCLREPGRLRTVIDLTDSLYRAIQSRNETYAKAANEIPTNEGLS